jgi:hypothetical protein
MRKKKYGGTSLTEGVGVSGVVQTGQLPHDGRG